jgi:hypothetical protein
LTPININMHMRLEPGRFALVGVLGLLLASKAAGSTPDVKLLRVPDGGLQPQALLDAQGTLHLVYLKGAPDACNVFYCERPAGQAQFSVPVRVNSVPNSAIAIGTVRGAQMALGRNGRVHVAWNGSNKGSSGANVGAPMLYTRINATGTGFEAQRNLMTITTHLDGGGSVAADQEGNVYVVWHGHRKTGPQEEFDRAVFLAFSSDEGSTFTTERQVNPPETGVCGCCGLKAFAGEHGSVAILYRSATPAGDRDTELLLSTNYGKSFSGQVLGQWHNSTCPMSTHALAATPEGFQGAWERQGQIYLAPISLRGVGAVRSVKAAGETTGRKHPAFCVGPGSLGTVLLAWTEGTGWERGGALAWEFLDSESRQVASGRVDGVPVWSYAAAVCDPGGGFTLIY